MANIEPRAAAPAIGRRSPLAIFGAGAALGVVATLLLGAIGGGDGREKQGSGRNGQPPSARVASKTGSSSGELSPRQASAELERALAAATVETKGAELDTLIDKASKFDPQASFDTALGLTHLERRRDALRRVLGTWVLQDQEGALAAIEGVTNVALRRDLLKSAISSLSRNNPEGAVAVLRATPSLRDDRLWTESFSIWAKSDPDAALAAWRSLDHPEERKDALRGITEALVRKDLPSAIAWASDFPSEGDRGKALHAVLRHAAESNPLLAAEQIGLLKQLGERDALDIAGRIAEEWAETDLTAAVAWAEDLPADQRASAISEIASDLVQRDPDVAEAMARGIDDTEQRRKLFGELARIRMMTDATDAVAWIANLPEGDQRSAWRSAAYEWSRTRPEEAAMFALSEDLDDYTRAQLIESATPQWARIDPAGAADWALTVPGRAGEGAMARVVDEWSRRDPGAAIGFLSNHVEGEQLAELTRRAVSSWSQEQPAEAASYAAELESGETKSAIFRSITERWMRADAMAASEWIASLEPSQERDSAVTSLIQRIERDDLESAFLWAEAISDGGRRKEMIKRLTRRLESEG